MNIPRITENLMRQLEGKFLLLSCNKYGSNVVEKIFLDSGEQYSTRIILELLQNPNVSTLLVDPFGNFVIKTALSVSKVRATFGFLQFLCLCITLVFYFCRVILIQAIGKLSRWNCQWLFSLTFGEYFVFLAEPFCFKRAKVTDFSIIFFFRCLNYNYSGRISF